MLSDSLNNKKKMMGNFLILYKQMVSKMSVLLSEKLPNYYLSSPPSLL